METTTIKKLWSTFLIVLLFLSCSGDDESIEVENSGNDESVEIEKKIEITIDDLSNLTFNEESNNLISVITSTTKNTDKSPTYAIVSQQPENAIRIELGTRIEEGGVLVFNEDQVTLTSGLKITGEISATIDEVTEVANFTITYNGTTSETPFITTWETLTDNESITIYTSPYNTFIYEYNIDWGDGSSDNNQTDSSSHSYATAGIYTVSISGDFPTFTLSNFESDMTSNASKFKSIESWGTNAWQSMQYMFSDSENFSINDNNSPDLSQVTTMAKMFYQSTFNGGIENWDVSNVTDMSEMFVSSSFAGQLDRWNVGKVINMRSMFAGSQFYGNIVNWDVSSVTDMLGMFANCPFNQDIGIWDVSNVTNMDYMFQNNAFFNRDLNEWNVGNVTSMKFMFSSNNTSSIFNSNISSWDVSKVTDMSEMFSNNPHFNQDIGSWNVSSVTNMRSMFNGSTAYNQAMNNWNVTNVINMSAMFANATIFDQDLSNWNTINVTDCNHLEINSSLSNNDLPVLGCFDNE